MQAIPGPDHTWDNISIKYYLPSIAIFTSFQIANLEKSIKRERGYGAGMVACAKATLFRPNFSPGIAAAANMPDALAKFGCKRSKFYLHRSYRHGKWGGEWNGLVTIKTMPIVDHKQHSTGAIDWPMTMKNALVKLWQAKKFLVTFWHIDQVFGHTLTHWPSVGHILHQIAAPKTPAVALCNCPGPRSLATTVSATTQLELLEHKKTKIYTTGILVLLWFRVGVQIGRLIQQ